MPSWFTSINLSCRYHCLRLSWMVKSVGVGPTTLRCNIMSNQTTSPALHWLDTAYRFTSYQMQLHSGPWSRSVHVETTSRDGNLCGAW